MEEVVDKDGQTKRKGGAKKLRKNKKLEINSVN